MAKSSAGKTGLEDGPSGIETRKTAQAELDRLLNEHKNLRKGFIETFFIAHSSSAKAEQQALDIRLADTDTPEADLSAIG